MSALLEVAVAATVGGSALAGMYAFARHVAAHTHQPAIHPNGRCPICGLDNTQEPTA